LTGVGQVLVLAKYAPGASTFCCGPSYNSTSQTCGEAPNTPFTIHLGVVINNRTSGSTSPNTTTSDSQNPPAVITTTTTATALANSSSNRETAIGVGVGVSLGVALLTALALLWRERRLRKKAEALNAPGDPSASAMVSNWHSGDKTNDYRGDVHQLDGSRMEELDGRQVNEMAARNYH
ncbi:hypothetical protein MMC07_008169, partial [Pseudocyphellaria aurata]|nr:hypothetical protein [Pseudocyphellaria aurata]